MWIYKACCSTQPRVTYESYSKDLVVMDKHISQALDTPVFDRLWLWLLQVAVMRSEPDFGRILKSNLQSNSFHDIIVGMLP